MEASAGAGRIHLGDLCSPAFCCRSTDQKDDDAPCVTSKECTDGRGAVSCSSGTREIAEAGPATVPCVAAAAYAAVALGDVERALVGPLDAEAGWDRGAGRGCC